MKSVVFVGIISALSVVVSGLVCPSVTCENFPDTANKDVCQVEKSVGLYYIHNCASSDIACENARCQNRVKKVSAGRKANVASECASGYLNYTTKICTGRKQGESCNLNTECDAGLYCSITSLTCVPRLGQGGICTWTELCKTGYSCLNGKCEAYLSQPVGTNVAATLGYEMDKRWLCGSFSLNAGLSHCVEAQKLTSARTISSSVNMEAACIYSDGTTRSAICSYSSSNPEHTGICPYGGGDFTVEDYSVIKTYLAASPVCGDSEVLCEASIGKISDDLYNQVRAIMRKIYNLDQIYYYAISCSLQYYFDATMLDYADLSSPNPTPNSASYLSVPLLLLLTLLA